MIKWSEVYSTGHPQIDQEHKILIDRLNELEQALIDGQGKSVIEPMLKFLEDYAAIHFRNEEACFEKYRCPVAAENKAAHQVFIRTFTEAKAKVSERGASAVLVLETHRKLGEWVRNHILKTDCKLRHSLPSTIR